MTWSALLRARVGSRAPAVIADDEVWTGDQLMQRVPAGTADWLDDVAAPANSPVACLLSTSVGAIVLTIAGASTRRPWPRWDRD